MKNLIELSILLMLFSILSCQNSDDTNEVINQPPEATNVQITGESKVGNVLSASYVYKDRESDKEKNTTISWLLSDTKNGNNSTEISSSSNYTIKEQDKDKYIAVKVTPKQTNGIGGASVTSKFIGPIIVDDSNSETTNNVTIGNKTLNIMSALILDSKGQNNPHSNKHYEYTVTLSDGVYVSGDTYKNGRYTITAELHSPGTKEFGFGTFNHCVFASCPEGIENKSFTSHVFIVEDVNDDDIIDFNTVDTDNNGKGKGSITFTKVKDDIFTISYDIDLESNEKLKGSYTGKFNISE